VGSFPARSRHKPSLSQIGDQLVDFSRHEVTANRYSPRAKGRQYSSQARAPSP
jgi:hypothetical protein